jgi:hypothetical protein
VLCTDDGERRLGDDLPASAPRRPGEDVGVVAEAFAQAREELEGTGAQAERHLVGMQAGLDGDAVLRVVVGDAVLKEVGEHLGRDGAGHAERQEQQEGSVQGRMRPHVGALHRCKMLIIG